MSGRFRWSIIAVGAAAILGFVTWLHFRPPRNETHVYRIGWMISPPFQVRGEDGRPSGLSVDLVNEAARRCGIPLKWVFWPDSSESALASKSVDLWPLITITANRLKLFHISDPYLQNEHCLLVRSDSRYRAVDDLAAATVGISNVSIDAPQLHSVLPGARPLIRPTVERLLEETCSGQADAAFTDKYTAISSLLDPPACDGHSLRWIDVPQIRSQLGVGSTFEARAAADAIREEIGVMAGEGRLAAIFGKWGFMSGHDVESVGALLDAKRRETRLLAATLLFACLFGLTCWQSLRLIREQKKTRMAEAALRESHARYMQAQKLESIGRLAGGIAHDFNNLLTVINGYSSVIVEKVHQADPLRPLVDEIRKAGDRAAELTQQLLIFGRKQVVQPRPVNLNSIVQDSERMFRRLLGEHIEVATSLAPGVRPIMADSGQIHQVLMNLVINARDAMPHGGRLVIRTDEVKIDDHYAAACPDATVGFAVRLTVTDTGKGMDEQTKEHMFEPFFTTKGVGQGTGFGLATVYAIVNHGRGWISVQSEPDHGSTFQIYFPAVEDCETVAAIPVAQTAPSRGSETVLVVEDQEDVRTFAVRALSAYGYRVLDASDGTDALALSCRHPGPIDLLLTDMVMPGMNGRELAQHLKTARPKLRVLYTSGYPNDMLADAAYLPKPYTAGELAAKIREVLRNAG